MMKTDIRTPVSFAHYQLIFEILGYFVLPWCWQLAVHKYLHIVLHLLDDRVIVTFWMEKIVLSSIQSPVRGGLEENLLYTIMYTV